MSDSNIKKEFSEIPSSIPMEHHTALLEDIYNKMGGLADGIMDLKNGQFETNQKIDRLDEKVDTIDTRLTSVEIDLAEIKDRLGSVEEKTNTIEVKVSNIESTMAKEEDLKDPINRITKLEQEILA